MKVDVFYKWVIEGEDDGFPTQEGYQMEVYKEGIVSEEDKQKMVSKQQRAYWVTKEVIENV